MTENSVLRQPPGGGPGKTPWGILCCLLLLGAAVFCTGIHWGLPSRAADPFLFGDRTPWTGQEIIALAGGWETDGGRGADVDPDAIRDRRQSIVLNETDAQRAAIVRRYRLYSYQPDEMVTFRALASMRPGEGKLDPHLYQYGGLWVYPVGACLQAASLAGFVTVKSDVTHYLDHPEQFARFYVVTRLYTVFWALVGAAVVFELARRLSGGRPAAATLATLCYIFLPVVVNTAHEAKPHLPGAVLMLASILAAMQYADTGRRRWWLASTVLCGTALGMVLTAWPILAIPPLMAWLRWNNWRSALGLKWAGLAITILVFLITNPYVGINLIYDREVLRSNLGNTAAMFKVTLSGMGLLNAAQLVREGASTIVAIVGCIATIGFLWRHIPVNQRKSEPTCQLQNMPNPGVGWLLVVPAAISLVQFALAAEDMPGEYGRFAVFPDVCLAVAAGPAFNRLAKYRTARGAFAAAMILGAALPGADYLRAFVRDCREKTSRFVAAEELQRHQREGGRVLGMLVEPAPYVCPPMNVFSWSIRLLPPKEPIEKPVTCDVLIRAWQTPEFPDPGTLPPERFARYDVPVRAWPSDATPMSWADKTFELVAPPQRPPENGATSSNVD